MEILKLVHLSPCFSQEYLNELPIQNSLLSFGIKAYRSSYYAWPHPLTRTKNRAKTLVSIDYFSGEILKLNALSSYIVKNFDEEY